MAQRGSDTVTASPLATSSPLVHGRAAAEPQTARSSHGGPPGSRRAGVLVHVTNLPGPDGMGDLGATARGFVEWLARAGQRAWQLLPLQAAADTETPWLPASAFAMDPLLLSLDDVSAIGLLPDTLPEIRMSVGAGGQLQGGAGADRLVRAARWKLPLVRQAARQLLSLPHDHQLVREYLAFCEREAWWLADHVAVTALREEYPGVPRSEWPAEERVRRLGAHRARSLEIGATHEHPEAVVQFLLDSQLRRLHAHARLHDVWLVADLPAWVSDDATDPWAHPELFRLDDAQRPAARAGWPPSAEHPAGVVWNAPGYDWQAHAATGFEWWRRRVRRAVASADVVRLDQARTFAEWWSVPPRAAYAEQGGWEPGPGSALVGALREEARSAELVLDDGGDETGTLQELRTSSGAASARVIVRGFDQGGASPHLPTSWSGTEVAYTGDPTSGTVAAWAAMATRAAAADDTDRRLAFALRFTGAAEPGELPRAAVESLLRSGARLAIVPFGDWLGADGATLAPGDRRWVLPASTFDDQFATELAATAARTGRGAARA